MFIASYSHTMANARAKIEEDGKPRFVDFAALRRQRERDEANERRRKERVQAEKLSSAKAEANAAVRAANEALARLHREWANEEKTEAERIKVVCEVSVHRIMRRFCYWTGISENQVLSARRDKRIVLIRHAIVYWACRRTAKSLPEIGRALGNRDHTTVLSAVRRYPAKRKAMGRNLREAR